MRCNTLDKDAIAEASKIVTTDSLLSQADTIGKYDFFKKYSILEQQEDLKILRTSLEKIHPGLYWYLSKTEFEKLCDSLLKNINSKKTAYQFLDDIFILTAKIHCSHTMANLSKAEKEFKLNNLPHFPFSVKLINNKLYIKDNYTNDNLFKIGTEIISINGIKTSDLIQKFIKRCHVDGLNRQGAISYMSTHFEILTEYNFNIPKMYSIEVLTPSGVNSKKDVNALNWTSIQEYQTKKYPIEQNETIKIIDSSKTAILTFNTFEDTSYLSFLEQSFKLIKDKNIQNLIIDLRKNAGGYDDFGQILYSYIALSPFKYYNHLEMKIDSLNDTIFNYGTFMDQEGVNDFFDKKHSKKMHNGNYILDIKKHPITANAPFLPKKNNFKGKVYVLISNASYSGASEFSSIAYFNKRATFIGQETGGGYSGNTSGFNYVLSLPNTKIRVVIPIIRYLVAIDNHEYKGGVKPDYEIVPTIDDLNPNSNREMKMALDLINKTK